MAKYITRIRTEESDMQIDYWALARLPIIDDTLTLSGEIAEAKTVGDKFNEVNQDVDLLTVNFNKKLKDLDTKLDNNVNLVNEKLDKKLDKSGGKMENPIDMGGFAITNVGDPTEDGDAANKAYVDNNIMLMDSLKAETDVYLGTFLKDEWVGDGPPYTQSITVEGILSSDTPFVDLNLDSVSDYTKVIEDWIKVGRITVSSDNIVTGYCYEDRPEIDMPMIFKVVR